MRRADLFRLVVQPAVGISVRGVHQAMLNTKLLMQDLSSRGAVRGATPVAYYHVLSRIVLLVVNAHHHRQIVILPGAEMMTRFAPPWVICTSAFRAR